VADVTKKMKGVWDSIHVLEVQNESKVSSYKLTSTIMLHMITQNEASGKMTLAGSITRQSLQECPVAESQDHVINMGRLVEEMENKMRNTLQEIYFGKTQDIVKDIRTITPMSSSNIQADLAKELKDKINQ
jgi:capping protein beta